MEAPPADGKWHLDRRVPLALIVTIAVQTGGAIWWASSISSRVSNLEKNNIVSTDQSGRIIRLETKIEGVEDTLQRIDQKLEKLIAK